MAQSLHNLERRTVVSVLLFPFLPYASKPYRILLFRRSDKVSTYQRKLAPIAGSVETSDKSPLDAAWRELNEETGFGPQHTELWRRGAGFSFTDETALSGRDGKGEKRGRIWTVWPFAFRLKKQVLDEGNTVQTLGLKLDWEHLNYEWKNVDDLLSGRILDDCVPRLETTLGQVWVDPESLLYQGLEELRLDHEHGARQLATMAVKTLIKIVHHDLEISNAGSPAKVHEWWKNFQMQAFHLAFNGRPSMGAAISSAIVTALRNVKDDVDWSGSDVYDNLKRSLEAYVSKRGEISNQVSRQFAMFFRDRFGARAAQERPDGEKWIKILTLSSSSTIKAAILHLLDTDDDCMIELRILESRPLLEGVKFAKALADEAQSRRENKGKGDGGGAIDHRLRIVLATDASAGVLSKDVDLVIIGADRISSAGDVSNKTGSLATVLLSKEVTNGSVCVACVSEAEKIATPGSTDEHADEDNDKAEVASAWQVPPSSMWDEMVTVRNVYFEWVPAKYIDFYVCEDGILSTTDIARRSERIAKLATEVFSDLHF